jgi:probable rRNA maturation factor
MQLNSTAAVHVTNNYRSYKVNRKQITTLAAEICLRLRVAHYEVCVQFVSPKVMRSLNSQYRDKDMSTDVLAFPQYNWKRALKFQANPPTSRPILNPLPLGDIVISTEDAAANAKESKSNLDKEICFLMVHGILHLVGHDHLKPAEKKRMFGEQKKLMGVFSGSKLKAPAWTGCVTPAGKSKSVTPKKKKPANKAKSKAKKLTKKPNRSARHK